jgi:hypothetical protein
MESATVVISVSIFWVQLNCRSRVANRQFVLASLAVNAGAVVIGGRVLWIELNRGRIVGDRLIQFCFVRKCGGTLEVNREGNVLARIGLEQR